MNKPHLHWPVQLLLCETHDYETERCHTIEHPLSKAEVVNEGVYVGWHNVDNSQKTLKQ